MKRMTVVALLLAALLVWAALPAQAVGGMSLTERVKEAGVTPTPTLEPNVETISCNVVGFQPFTVEITLDNEGKIVSVDVPEHNETPGLGAALLKDAAIFETLVSRDIMTAQIDIRAGVTLTSNAINEALHNAAQQVGKGGSDANNVETISCNVVGFQPFTVEITLDNEGKIVSVEVPEHNETPGLGAALLEDAVVFKALVGRDITTAQIDIRAGVTLTSNAINDALKQATDSITHLHAIRLE